MNTGSPLIAHCLDVVIDVIDKQAQQIPSLQSSSWVSGVPSHFKKQLLEAEERRNRRG